MAEISTFVDSLMTAILDEKKRLEVPMLTPVVRKIRTEAPRITPHQLIQAVSGMEKAVRGLESRFTKTQTLEDTIRRLEDTLSDRDRELKSARELLADRDRQIARLQAPRVALDVTGMGQHEYEMYALREFLRTIRQQLIKVEKEKGDLEAERSLLLMEIDKHKKNADMARSAWKKRYDETEAELLSLRRAYVGLGQKVEQEADRPAKRKWIFTLPTMTSD